MTRSPHSPFLISTILLLGIVVGMTLDRSTPSISAQPPASSLSSNVEIQGDPLFPPATAALPGSVVVVPSVDTAKATTTTSTAADSSANKPSPNPTSTSANPKPAVKDAQDAAYDELARQYPRFEAVNQAFEMTAKVVSRSVVHIVAVKNVSRTESKTVVATQETGSGVIVRPDKSKPNLVVLTNHHVVDGVAPNMVRVTLWDGQVLHPKQIWSDKRTDVAILQIDRVDVPAARLGDSDKIEVGAWVLALGSPFGLRHSVTHGIISARGRHEEELQNEGVYNQDFLQTDAAINPGNSGGPLVNLKGEVIGINTAIATNHGGNEGVGFSIPINLAKWIMDQLVRKGRVTRGGIGIDLGDISAESLKSMGLAQPRGALITNVRPDTPAEVAGLRTMDVILRFGGIEVKDLNHLINLVAMSPVGKSVDVVLWRSNAEYKVKVNVVDRDQIPSLSLEDNGGSPSSSKDHEASNAPNPRSNESKANSPRRNP